MTIHRIQGDKVRLYRRVEGGRWHCSTFLDGKEYRKTTKRKDLTEAKKFAVAWYKDLCDSLGIKHRVGRNFAEVASAFELEYETINQGRRSPNSIRGHKDRLRLHLVPYFGGMPVEEITADTVRDYRAKRMTAPGDGDASWTPPARSTIHSEIVTLRMVLKTAQRHGWIDEMPDMSDPCGPTKKTEPRPWFTPEEYDKLCLATRRNAENPTRRRFAWHAEQLHDFVVFMGNTGLRPNEANALTYGDVEIVFDEDTGRRVLEIAVPGKRGVTTCKRMPGAVRAFERMRVRNSPKQRDRLFPTEYKKMFNRILTETNLKFDRNGKPRTAYSLRHSYICSRLLAGDDIYDIARACRTSVEMIEKHYVAHMDDMTFAHEGDRQRQAQPEAEDRPEA